MIMLSNINTVMVKENKYLFLCIFILICHKMTALNYYINDTSLDGDLYTRAIGNDFNDGLTPDSPKRTVTVVYHLAKEGDVVYIDSGKYSEISSNGELLFENKKKIRFIIAGNSEGIFSKTPFPANEKNTPEIFYIKNDQPVSRETYLKQLHSNSKE